MTQHNAHIVDHFCTVFPEELGEEPSFALRHVEHMDVALFVSALRKATCNIPQVPTNSLMCPQVPASSFCTLCTGASCAQISGRKQN